MAAYTNPDFTKISLQDAPKSDSAEWQQLFKAKAGAEFDALTKRTMEHVPVKPLYNHDEYDHMNHLDFASGIPPCLRGPYSTMYVFRPWTVRQYAGFSTAEESNAFIAGIWQRGRRDFPLPLTFQPIAAMTRIIPVL